MSTAAAPDRRTPAASLRAPIAREDGWISPTRVRLLNIEREFEGDVEWRPPDVPRLWTYTLNYFQDLPQCVSRGGERPDGGLDVEQAVRLVDSWIEANPPGTTDTWDPYPISIRVVNWIKWALLLESAEGAGPAAGSRATGPPSAGLLDSLATQLRSLERRLEFDIAANHLMANAVALTAGGLFFGAEEGDRWAAIGLALLTREMDEQVLDDGGHFERSPMYHAVVLEQLLDVLNLCAVFPGVVAVGGQELRSHLEGAARAMLNWLSAMTHPDGGAAFFNDTTLGAAASCAELFDYAERLGLAPARRSPGGVHLLDSTGFFRFGSEDDRTVVLFDAGGPEPGYQPGHAHSESLSFELSRDGRRLFVNSGVSTYDPGHDRLRQRSTAAHNTVRVDEREQSELWASHRCGRRARVSRAIERSCWASAAHDGYRFLPGRPLHHRKMRVTGEGVEIVDNISGRGEHFLEWFFHLHPDVVARVSARAVELSSNGRPVASISFPFGATASIEKGSWHPAFNVAVPNTLVHLALQTNLPFEFDATIVWL
ncbi:MAG: alginate lyase family protein [Candidatus Eisenbacteria bacterium]